MSPFPKLSQVSMNFFVSHSPTSKAAAEAIKPTAGTLRAAVLELLKAKGPLTDEQIADALEMNPSTARPRRIELKRAGLIREAGTAKTKSGRDAAKWEAA